MLSAQRLKSWLTALLERRDVSSRKQMSKPACAAHRRASMVWACWFPPLNAPEQHALAMCAQLRYNHAMAEYETENITEDEASGSDELLAADELRLPEGASTPLRLHALRAWLEQRRTASELEIGAAALALQTAMCDPEMHRRTRRRWQETNLSLGGAQLALSRARMRQSAYQEASTLLEECVTHTTTAERLLVEYYLSLEELAAAGAEAADPPWREAMQDVLHRVEQVGSPTEEIP
jgi:hypothetical protein